jgi:hypothetical protein
MGAFKIFRKFSQLLDRTTVDLPAINAPLSQALDTKVDSSSLSYVALSGSYDDLIDVPSPSPGVSEVADLTDATTYDFPNLNTPLVNALAGKSSTGHTHSNAEVNTAIAASPATSASAMGLGTGDAPTFAGLKTTGNVGIGTTAPFYRAEIVGGASGVSTRVLSLRSNGTGINTGTSLKFTNSTDASTNLGSEITSLRTNRATAGDTDLVFSTSMAGLITERLRIQDTGNVGVGTTAPTTRLDVVGEYNSTPLKVTRFGSSYGDVIQLGRAGFSASANIGYPADSTINFSTSGAERVRITSAGNVGIGTTAPSDKLDVVGNINVVGSSARIGFNAGNMAVKDEGGYKLGFQTYNSTSGTITTKMVLDTNGNVGIGTTSPAYKLDIFGKVGVHTDGTMRWGNAFDSGKLTWDTGKAVIRGETGKALSLGANGTQDYLYITTTGNVGIGTTAPSAKLEVAGSSKFLGTTHHSWFNNGSSEDTYIRGGKATSKVYINDSHSADVVIASGGGKVGIGTTAPANKLDIRQGTSSGSDVLGVGAISIGSDNPYWTFRGTAISLQDLAFDRFYGGTWYESMRIQRSSGNVGIGTTTPAEKLDVVGNIKASGTVQTGSYTVGTLPLTPSTGMRAQVTDSSQTLAAGIGTTLVAGGSNIVPVFYDGTNWIIA